MNGCNFINYLYSENVGHKYSSVQNTNVMEYGFKNLHNVYIKNTQNMKGYIFMNFMYEYFVVPCLT